MVVKAAALGKGPAVFCRRGFYPVRIEGRCFLENIFRRKLLAQYYQTWYNSFGGFRNVSGNGFDNYCNKG